MRPFLLLALLLSACAPSLEDSVGTIARATSIAQQTAVRAATQDTYVDRMTQQAIEKAGAEATISAAKLTQQAQVESDRLTQEAVIRADNITQQAIIALDKRHAQETAQAKWEESEYNRQRINAAWWAETWDTIRAGAYIVGAVLALVGLGALWNWDTRRQQAHEQRLQLEKNAHAEEMAKISAVREIEMAKAQAEIDRLKIMVLGDVFAQRVGDRWVPEYRPGIAAPAIEGTPPATPISADKRRLALIEFADKCIQSDRVLGQTNRAIPSGHAIANKFGSSHRGNWWTTRVSWLVEYGLATQTDKGGYTLSNGLTLGTLLDGLRNGEIELAPHSPTEQQSSTPDPSVRASTR